MRGQNNYQKKKYIYIHCHILPVKLNLQIKSDIVSLNGGLQTIYYTYHRIHIATNNSNKNIIHRKKTRIKRYYYCIKAVLSFAHDECTPRRYSRMSRTYFLIKWHCSAVFAQYSFRLTLRRKKSCVFQ